MLAASKLRGILSNRRSSLGRVAALGLLAVAVVYQGYLVYRNYGQQWLKAAYRTAGLSSMHRSARFLLGESGASYIAFLRSVIPEVAPVVKPEGVGIYAEQNVMQFFLMPRGIPACPCEYGIGNLPGDCAQCLAQPSHYVPSIGGFQPDSVLAGEKRYIEFPGESDLIHGLYAPPSAEIGDQEPFAENSFVGLARSALLSLFAFIGIVVVGIAVSDALLGGKHPVWSFALAFPVGAGLSTWVVFLLSWVLAVRVTLVSYLASLGLILLGVYLARPKISVKPSLARVRALPQALGQWRGRLARLDSWIWAAVIGVLLASALISVVRSYSTFDDIANWALKGYAIAEEGSVFAGERWGGHALEYPQNLPLQISLFKLLDDDYLPGSKLLFPAYLGSLILGGLAFWKSANVDRNIATVGTLAIATTPMLFLHSTLGFANLPMSAYLVLGVLITVEGIRDSAAGKQIVGSLLIGLAAWTRLEAAVYSLALLLSFAVATKALRLGEFRLRSLAAPMLLVQLPWLLFYFLHGRQTGGAFETAQIISQAQSLFGSAAAETVSLIREHIAIQLRNVSRWGAIVQLSIVGFPIGIARAIRARDRSSAILAICMGASLLMILSTFFIIGASGRHDFTAWLDDSFDRHLIPVFLLMLVFSVHGMARNTGPLAPGEP